MKKNHQTTPPSRGGSHWLRKGLLGLVVTILFLGVLEWGFRALLPMPGADIAIPAKPPQSLRIVIAGGSTAEGFPVPPYGFAAQLEAAARAVAPHQSIQVLNLGASGRASPYVRRVVESCREVASPDAIIVLCGHNEYLDRSGESLPRPDLADAIRETGLARGAHELAHAVRRRTRSNHSLPESLPPYQRGSAWFSHVQRRYHQNLAAMAETAAAQQVPFILCTAPSNLADWEPVWRGLSPNPDQPERDLDLAALHEAVAQRAWPDASRLAESLAERYPDNAYVAYATGRCRQAAGDMGAAATWFTAARDLDPIPWRAGTAINDIIRAVAAEHPAVILADQAPGRLPGFDSFDDNCHPTPRGNAVIALVLLNRLVQAGVIQPKVAPPADAAAWLETYRASLGSPDYVAALDARRQLRSGMYCMKHPFMAFEVSERHLQAAMQASPGMWETWGNLGALRMLEDRWEEGRQLLAHAETLRGLPLDPSDISTVPYLAEALRRDPGSPSP